jgi:SAM-dependent methyltransferase
LATSRYLLSSTVPADEAQRLAMLSDLTNEATFDRLGSFGPMTGWRCIDIGAGDGSVARWLAGQVGAEGRVVATDLELDRLAPGDGVEQRRLDLVDDDLEAGAYDLVHARSVLLHVADPHAALGKMVVGLRRGGVLVVEDADLTTFAACDSNHRHSAAFEACMHRFTASMVAAGVHTKLGPKLPALLSRVGLGDVDCAARLLILRGGSPGATLWKRNVANALGDVALPALDDPTFWFASTLRVQAWGRAPDRNSVAGAKR